jgi:hypothetical protein
MAEAEKGAKKQSNPQADAKNWEDRLRTEAEAPHKWNESWGELFNNGVPHDYSERIKYFEKEVAAMPAGSVLPKYGVGKPFKEVGIRDYKRKKMFQAEVYDD